MEWVILTIAGVSLTNIIVNEYIFSPIRNFLSRWFPKSLLYKLLTCMTCAGFWVGFGLSFLFPDICPIIGGLVVSLFNKLWVIYIE